MGALARDGFATDFFRAILAAFRGDDMKRISTFAAGAVLLSLVSPAGAQVSFMPDVIGATIGNMAAASARYKDCLKGKKPAKPQAVAEARGGARAALAAYLRAAGTGPGVDAAAAFTAKPKLRAWLRDGQEGAATAVDDPMAVALAAGRGKLIGPTAFVRSGDGMTALALWRVAASDEAPLGYYRTGFRREAKIWRLTRMELVSAPAEPEPVVYYCATPGDSEEYAKAVAERDAKRERKRAERAARGGASR